MTDVTLGPAGRQLASRAVAEVMSAGDQAAALAAIAARDPAFDVHAFLSEVAQTYLDVQRARAAGNGEAVAGLVGAAARTQLGLDRPAPTAPGAPVPVLGELSVVQASTDQAWDSIVVRIPASSGGASTTEDWCFQRPAGSTSVAASSAATCPSCGAPRQATPAGTCRYCGAPLTSASRWTVTRVAAVADPAPAQGQTATDLASALATLMQAAAAARQGSGATTPSRPSRASRASGCGCLLVLALIVGIPGAILAYAAANPTSGLHRSLHFLPFLQRGYVTGHAVLSGSVNTKGSTADYVPGVNPCDKMYLKSKELHFNGTMADGSHVTVKVDSRYGGVFGTAHYTTNQDIVVSPSLVTAAGVSQQWEPVSGQTRTSFVLGTNGSGQLTIDGYAPARSGPGEPTGPLALTIDWTCANR